MAMQNYKIVVVGDAEVGKTSFLARHSSGDFTNEYHATLGVMQIPPLTFPTNYGEISFNIFDCSGEKRHFVPRQRYCRNADAALVFHDISKSGDNVASWVEWTRSVSPAAHIVICGTKCDLVSYESWKLPPFRELGCQYHVISSKSNYQYERPFVTLARLLTGHDDLCFVDTEQHEEKEEREGVKSVRE